VILAAAIGFALEATTSVEGAVLPALLLGMVVAPLVPAKTACRIDMKRSDDSA